MTPRGTTTGPRPPENTALEAVADVIRMLPQRYVERFPLAELTDYPGNPKDHDLAMIHESVSVNGFYGVLIAQDWPRTPHYVLAGHGRRETLLADGQTHAPVLFLTCDPTTARRIVSVDNRSVGAGGFNLPDLVGYLRGIVDGGGTLSGTGYTSADLDRAVRELETPVYTPHTTRVLVNVTCPHCKKDFGIDRRRRATHEINVQPPHRARPAAAASAVIDPGDPWQDGARLDGPPPGATTADVPPVPTRDKRQPATGRERRELSTPGPRKGAKKKS